MRDIFYVVEIYEDDNNDTYDSSVSPYETREDAVRHIEHMQYNYAHMNYIVKQFEDKERDIYTTHFLEDGSKITFSIAQMAELEPEDMEDYDNE